MTGTSPKRNTTAGTILMIGGLLLALSFTECGGGSSGPVEAPPVDTTPPIVSTVSPANGATNVQTTSTISITFNEAMSASTINAATFLVREGSTQMAGTISSSGGTYTFTPTGSLAATASYTVTVTTGVRDVSGNAMAANFTSIFATTGSATVFPPAISLTRVAGGFIQPVTITHAGDGSGRLFIVEQSGRIRIIRNGAVLPVPFLDISDLVTPTGGEQGLLGLAFPRGFSARRTFYVNYTDRTGVGNTVIARFGLSADGDRADPLSRRELLNIVQPFANHNGGQLAFGPDNNLYIGSGDGGSGGDPRGNGQNPATLLGKILRIDVLSGAAPYAVPAGNPFGNEIWSYGLRNPWRFSFDRLTGDFYVADVGQSLVEEINFQHAGSGAGINYGWNVMEGSRCFGVATCSTAGLTLPVAEYLHGNGDCSVTGGYVYRGAAVALQGIYLYGDFCSGRIWGMRRTGAGFETALLTDTPLSISTFGEDEAGELYVADYATGAIYRIASP